MPVPSEVLSSPERLLVLPGGEKEDHVSYAVLPRARIITSHRRQIGRVVPEPDYPQRLQHRAYSGRRAISVNETFLTGAMNLDPSQLLDLTSSTALGPPVVARRRSQRKDAPDDFLCVVGNHRVLITDYAKTDYPDRLAKYRHELKEMLARFDLPDLSLEASEQPILVRVLTTVLVDERGPDGGAAALARLGHINRLSDASFTKARDPAALGFVYARELLLRRSEAAGAGLFAWLIETLREHGTTNTLLASAAGSRLVDKLIEVDVVPREELMLFKRPNDGRPTAFGALCLRSMLFALAFDDPDVIDGGDPKLLSRLEPSLGYLIAARGAGDWDIAAHVGRACMLVGAFSDPFGPRKHLSLIGRATRLSEIVTMSALKAASLFADVEARDYDQRRALAFVRAFAGIFLCESHQSARSLATCFARWRDTALAFGGQLSLDMFGANASSPEIAVAEVFCRTRDVADWVNQQLTPPFDPYLHPSPSSKLRRLRRRVHSLEEGICFHANAVGIWDRIHAVIAASTSPATPRRQSEGPSARSGFAGLTGRGRGRPPKHADSATFAAIAIRTLASPVIAEAVVSQTKGPSERQCRRRLAAWRADDVVWIAVCAALPELRQLARGRRPKHLA